MKSNESTSKRLRTSGVLIIVGLLVEALSLVWNHPLSFVAFVGIGGLFLAVGILRYLWTLVSVGSGSPPSDDRAAPAGQSVA